MKSTNRIISILFPLAFVAAGIFLIVISAGKIIKIHSNAYTPTTAVVDHIDVIPSDEPSKSDDRNVYVRYTAGGQEYIELLEESSDDMVTGQTIDVIYETENPKNVTTPGTTGAYIRIGLGALGILLGIIAFIRGLAGR